MSCVIAFLKKSFFGINLILLIPGVSYSQNIDIDILRKINHSRIQSLDNTFKVISYSAVPISIGTPIILYGVGLLNNDSILKRNAIYIGVAVGSATIITTLMKYSINRTRPYITYPDIQRLSSGGSPSFPSGHTTDAFALATSLSLKYPKIYVILPSYTWAILVGYSRMNLGVHYPSDVLVGCIIGIGSAYLCYIGQKYLDNLFRKYY